MACLALAVAEVTCAQSLEKIQWFNEPERWTAEDGILTMQVPPHCDYWRVSHYGFTVDDAPFCYAIYGGEFEAKVKVTGDYKTRFDQAGLMLRIDAENYIKAGVEFVDGKFNLSQKGCMEIMKLFMTKDEDLYDKTCLLYTSPSPRDCS